MSGAASGLGMRRFERRVFRLGRTSHLVEFLSKCSFESFRVPSPCVRELKIDGTYFFASVPERCLNMPSIQSLNPLRTLHDSLGLPQVEEYLNRMTQGSDGTVYTPEGTPTRKPPAKRLHLKPATHKRVGKLTEPAVRRSWDLSDLAGKATATEGVTMTESSPTVTTIMTAPAATANTTTSAHQCTLAAATPDTTATSDDSSDTNSAESHKHNSGHISSDN